jgi:hypothetical protein
MLQQLAYGALVVLDAETLGDHTLKVDAPPAHHAIDGVIRAGLDDLGQLRLLGRRQPARLLPRQVVLQPLRTARVEPVNPIPQRLTIHAADLRGFRPAHPIQRCSYRQ